MATHFLHSIIILKKLRLYCEETILFKVAIRVAKSLFHSSPQQNKIKEQIKSPEETESFRKIRN